jgi:predicted nucleotidyltransferase
VRAAAASVASRVGLPEDWLNDGAKGYVHGLAPGEVLFSAPGLIVRSVAAPQLLAMKLSAWRDDLDVADARLLLSKIPGERASVWRQVEPHLVPGRQLKAQYAFEDLWEADRGPA